MLRIANPGSNIGAIVRIFQALVGALEERQPFTLDDMSRTLVESGLATSSGFTGQRALERSTRADRSRDPLYNQSKMHSELFRLLGWVRPTVHSRQEFRFTWIGLHVLEAAGEARTLVAECALTVVFPNPSVEAKGEYTLRPFAAILRAADRLDGLICRDEMIVGPLSLHDDTSPGGFESMMKRLEGIRGSTGRLRSALDGVAKSSGIKLNTMRNYTRFPLAMLTWAGWTDKTRSSSEYGKPLVFHQLTDKGRDLVRRFDSAADVRASQLLGLPEGTQREVCRLAVLRTLERAGFDVGSYGAELDRGACAALDAGVISDVSQDFIFSPYQEMPTPFTHLLFRDREPDASDNGRPDKGKCIKEHTTWASVPVAPLVLRHVGDRRGTGRSEEQAVCEALGMESLGGCSGVDAVVDLAMKHYAEARQQEFYPLVARLVSALGLDCSTSRVGVNYARWDAIIKHPTDTVPVEVKSPTEEVRVSTKAVRQALENRIILLARKEFPTSPSSSSLVVGYMFPTDRSEVGSLIADIYSAFGVSIGLVDLRSLLVMAIGALVEGQEIDESDLLHLRGFSDVIGA